MMTDEYLAKIRAAANEATPGPWKAEHAQFGPRVTMSDNCHFDGEVSYPVWDCDDPQDGCMDEQAQWMHDACFMADARQVIPDLLAYIAELEAKIAAK